MPTLLRASFLPSFLRHYSLPPRSSISQTDDTGQSRLVVEHRSRRFSRHTPQRGRCRSRGREGIVVVNLREAHCVTPVNTAPPGAAAAATAAATVRASRPEAKVFEAVDVEVDGTVDDHEEVRDVGDGLHPWRPLALVLAGKPGKLVEVWDPLHGVAQDEDEYDRQ